MVGILFVNAGLVRRFPALVAPFALLASPGTQLMRLVRAQIRVTCSVAVSQIVELWQVITEALHSQDGLPWSLVLVVWWRICDIVKCLLLDGCNLLPGRVYDRGHHRHVHTAILGPSSLAAVLSDAAVDRYPAGLAGLLSVIDWVRNGKRLLVGTQRDSCWAHWWLRCRVI